MIKKTFIEWYGAPPIKSMKVTNLLWGKNIIKQQLFSKHDWKPVSYKPCVLCMYMFMYVYTKQVKKIWFKAECVTVTGLGGIWGCESRDQL